MKICKILVKSILVIPMLCGIVSFFVNDAFNVNLPMSYIPGIPFFTYMLILAAFGGGALFDLFALSLPIFFVVGACFLGKRRILPGIIVCPILLLSVWASIFLELSAFNIIASIIYFIIALLVSFLPE